MRQYKDYLPPEIQKYLEFNVIGSTVDSQFNGIFNGEKRLYDNSFISTLDDYGCSRWEKMLHLVKRDTDSIEDRRLRILTKFLNKLPYTEKRLREMMDSICGRDGYIMNVDINKECVWVRIELTRRNQINDVKKMLEDVVPLNLWLDVDLRYNQHNYVGNYRHRHLKKFTHKQIKEENLGIQKDYLTHLKMKVYKHSDLGKYSHSQILEGEV